LKKSKLDSQNFSKTARRQALDTVRETKLLAGQQCAECEQFALECILRLRTKGFSRSDNEYSARIPVSKEKFKKTSKIQSGSVTQKVSQGILETQKFTNQEKRATRANGHNKFKKPKTKG
jgi:hypothetical protein